MCGSNRRGKYIFIPSPILQSLRTLFVLYGVWMGAKVMWDMSLNVHDDMKAIPILGLYAV